MYDAHQEAFSEETDFEKDPFDEWMHWSYREPFDPALWFVARDGDEIAGIALCRAVAARQATSTSGWVNILGVRKPWRRRGLGKALLEHAFREFRARGKTHAGLGVDGAQRGGARALRAGRDGGRALAHVVRKAPLMSRLRAKCPDCKTQTAVALGPEYECHACGRTFGAGMVRVRGAWGEGGEAMLEAAWLPLPYPEAAVIEEETLGEQSLSLAHDLPARPLVLGGDCCSHIGAVEGLSAGHDRIGVVWFDAHGDLNTPESSPSGNAWGMPLRMLIDSGAVAAENVALVGARNLDPPEEEFIAASGLHQGGADAIARALDGLDCVYVALDGDVFDPGEIASFMPEPGGLTVDEVEPMLRDIAARHTVIGAGLSALAPEERNVEPLSRLCAALGL